jgi:putative ABC transport system substrate-binding protein
MMDRRALLIGATAFLATHQPASAQRGGNVYRFGVLSSLPIPFYMTPFIEGLHELGWVETRDFTLEYRVSGDTPGGADTAARELVAMKVDMIVTAATGNAVAASRATALIPIVMISSGYPVEVGLVKSYARPGGNVTGNTVYAGAEVFGKHVEILKMLLPRMQRLAVLWGYVPPFVYVGEGELALAELKRATKTLGITTRVWETRQTEDVELALKALATERADALYVSGGSAHLQTAARIVEFARGRRLPTLTDIRAVFQAGMLITYSANPAVLARQAAGFIDRILRGARPGELPIERPSKIDLIINMKAAKALGLTIPPSLLLRADQVIEE